MVFDASRTTFRNEIYPDYKAHRPEPPPELVPQFALIRDATDALGVCKIEQEGYEADDMIAAYARAFEGMGGRVTIVSSDKDLMQLVRPCVEMLDPIKQKPIREAEVAEKFGVSPGKVVDVQALAGDPTDNVPGVPGIGVKTAAQLITEYGSVEALLDNAEKIKQPKRREALLANREQALVSKKLVALDADAPLPAPVEKLEARAPERASLESFLRAQGFRSIIARLGLGEAAGDAGTRARNSAVAAHQAAASVPTAPVRAPGEAAYGPYETVTDMAALRRWIAEAQLAGVVGFDTETDCLDAMRATLVGVSLATAPGRACYVPLRHGKAGDMLAEKPAQLDPAEALEALRPLLTDPGTLKVLAERQVRPGGAGAAGEWRHLRRPGGRHHAHLLQHGGRAPRARHGRAGGAPSRPQADLLRRGDGHRARARPLRRGAARPRHRLRRRGRGRHAPPATTCSARGCAPRGALALYEGMERRMIAVLRDMEMAGIHVDEAELRRTGEEFAERLVTMEAEIHRIAGRPFAVGSPKQLGEILFGEMGLAGGRRGKSGAYSTDVFVLEELAAQGHELPRKVLDWRQIAKLKSTYVDGLLAQIDPRTGRVHTELPDGGRLDRPPFLDRPEPAEHPDPHRGGRAPPPRLRGGAGARAAGRRLQPDRAAAARACGGRALPARGLRARRGHPQPHRRRHLPPRSRQGGPRKPPPRQDDQFRHHLRHERLRPRHPARPSRRARRGASSTPTSRSTRASATTWRA